MCVHDIVTQMSPVKVSKRNSSIRYFDGKISDGQKSIRLASFDPGLRAALELARTSVAFRNCQIKAVSGSSRGWGGGEVEIMTTR